MSDKKDSLEILPESDLKENEILERYNLQKAIVNSWEAFTREIGMPDLFLIGQEIRPHDSVADSIDILAYDANDNVAVVFELKRGKDKFQLLQAITYAAMVSSWPTERFLIEAKKQSSESSEDLTDTLSESEFTKQVRIVLIAERFDPEVIIASDWLLENHKVDITAFGIDVFKQKDQIYLSLNQKYPLSELHESYEARTTKVRRLSAESKITWEEVAEKLKYSWGKSAIEVFRTIREGEPQRRRFRMIKSHYEGFDWISASMRRSFINVYLRGKPPNAESILKSPFREAIKVLKWRDGYSFNINSESQFEDLLAWLKIETNKSKKKAA